MAKRKQSEEDFPDCEIQKEAENLHLACHDAYKVLFSAGVKEDDIDSLSEAGSQKILKTLNHFNSSEGRRAICLLAVFKAAMVVSNAGPPEMKEPLEELPGIIGPEEKKWVM